MCGYTCIQEVTKYEGLRASNMDALKKCQKKIVEHALDMRCIAAEWQFDRKKLTFYFSSESVRARRKSVSFNPWLWLICWCPLINCWEYWLDFMLEDFIYLLVSAMHTRWYFLTSISSFHFLSLDICSVWISVEWFAIYTPSIEHEFGWHKSLKKRGRPCVIQAMSQIPNHAWDSSCTFDVKHWLLRASSG